MFGRQAGRGRRARAGDVQRVGAAAAGAGSWCAACLAGALARAARPDCLALASARTCICTPTPRTLNPQVPYFLLVRRAASGLAAPGRAAGAGWQWREQAEVNPFVESLDHQRRAADRAAARAAPAEGSANGKGAPAPGARPGQKAGKVVFGSGNRLLDKQLATQGKARPALARACWQAQ